MKRMFFLEDLSKEFSDCEPMLVKVGNHGGCDAGFREDLVCGDVLSLNDANLYSMRSSVYDGRPSSSSSRFTCALCGELIKRVEELEGQLKRAQDSCDVYKGLFTTCSETMDSLRFECSQLQAKLAEACHKQVWKVSS